MENKIWVISYISTEDVYMATYNNSDIAYRSFIDLLEIVKNKYPYATSSLENDITGDIYYIFDELDIQVTLIEHTVTTQYKEDDWEELKNVI